MEKGCSQVNVSSGGKETNQGNIIEYTRRQEGYFLVKIPTGETVDSPDGKEPKGKMNKFS